MPVSDLTETTASRQPAHQNDDVIDLRRVDLEALAEEIVKLLKQELRLENERRGWHRVW